MKVFFIHPFAEYSQLATNKHLSLNIVLAVQD